MRPLNLSSESDTDRLRQLIGRKHQLLTQLHRIAGQQARLVDAHDMHNLLGLLAGKQTLLEELQRVERGLDPYRQQAPDDRRWRSSDDRAACAEQMRECEFLLREIVEMERKAEAEMVRRRDGVVERLDNSGSASEARRAYNALTPAAPSQLDLTSDAAS